MHYFRRVLPYLKPYKGLTATLLLLIGLSVLTGLLTPLPLKYIIDNVLGHEPLPGWLPLPLQGAFDHKVVLLFVVVVFGWSIHLVGSLVGVAQAYVQTKVEQSIALDFRSDMYTHAQKLSMSYYDESMSGLVMYQVNFQGDAASSLLMSIPPLLQSFGTLVGMFVIWLTLDPVLAIVAVGVVPFLYYSVGYYATHIQGRLRHVKILEATSLSYVHEALQMFRVVKAFCREPYEFRRFRDVGERAVDARVKITVRQTLFNLAVNMTTATGTAVVLGMGALHVLHGKLTLGELTVVLYYLSQVYGPLEAISYTIGALQDKFVSLGFAWALLDEDPAIKDAPNAVALQRALGRITYENVNFRHQGRDGTLFNISFDARPGQVIAVVGPTGAGKTSLVSLIPRFYEAQSGRVLIDGVDIRKITQRSLREQIALVPQEPLLFNGTIAENIGYGRLEATREQIIEAARAANAHDFISRLPKGYDTPVGEAAAQLSGGERQRMCVARAFLKDAPILILDEPTSAIDSKTEAVILDALDRLMVGRTTFMIAHRLSTIHHSDWVLVMEHGRIVEQGTHTDLMERAGLYKHLNDIQSGHRLRRRGAAAALKDAEIGAEPSASLP